MPGKVVVNVPEYFLPRANGRHGQQDASANAVGMHKIRIAGGHQTTCLHGVCEQTQYIAQRGKRIPCETDIQFVELNPADLQLLSLLGQSPLRATEQRQELLPVHILKEVKQYALSSADAGSYIAKQHANWLALYRQVLLGFLCMGNLRKTFALVAFSSLSPKRGLILECVWTVITKLCTEEVNLSSIVPRTRLSSEYEFQQPDACEDITVCFLFPTRRSATDLPTRIMGFSKV